MENEIKIGHLNINFNDFKIKSNGIDISIDQKAVEVLDLLIKNNHQTVSIDTFMDAIWADKPSSPEVVTSAIARLRKIFKMTGIGDDLITTVHKIGYRFDMPNEMIVPGTPIINISNSNQSKESGFNDKRFYYLFLPFVLLTCIALYFTHNNSMTKINHSTHQKQAEFKSILKESNSNMTQIYILRHTEKSDTENEDPQLSEAGINRANYWKKVLQYVNIDRIYTTNYIRNKQTANILKGDKNITPEIYYPMSFEVLDFIKNIQGQKVLIIGHSNTIPDMINRIIGESTYPPMSHKNYNLMHLVTISTSGETSSNVLHIDTINKAPSEVN